MTCQSWVFHVKNSPRVFATKTRAQSTLQSNHKHNTAGRYKKPMLYTYQTLQSWYQTQMHSPEEEIQLSDQKPMQHEQ